jgi:hypothetical protein
MDRVGVASGTSAADRVYFELGRFFDWFAARDDDFRSPLVRSMKRHAPGDGARLMTDDELRVFGPLVKMLAWPVRVVVSAC